MNGKEELSKIFENLNTDNFTEPEFDKIEGILYCKLSWVLEDLKKITKFDMKEHIDTIQEVLSYLSVVQTIRTEQNSKDWDEEGSFIENYPNYKEV